MRINNAPIRKLSLHAWMTAAALLLVFSPSPANAQELQLHYDFRHTVDPKLNPKNFPMVVFKYFKELDSAKTGSFLFEAQAFFNGEKYNVGQTLLQASQTIKFWRPKIYLYGSFIGGVGLAPPSYGYYIPNAYGIGLSVPVVRASSWFNFSLAYRFTPNQRYSNEVQLNAYAGGGLFNFKVMYSCTLVSWLTDRSNMAGAESRDGKIFAFFADPQVWYNVGEKFWLGTRVTLYHHVLDQTDDVQAYPTIGVKRNFN